MRVILIYLSILASLLMMSCNGAKNSKFRADNGIVFDTIKVDKQYFLKNDSTKPSCSIHIKFVYPVSSKYADLDSLQRIFLSRFLGASYDSLGVQDAVDKYVANFIASYKDDVATYQKTLKNSGSDDIFAPVFTHDEDISKLSERFYFYREELSNSIFYNSQGVLSFQVKQSNNKGNADAFNSYHNYSIDLSKLDIITEDDIFTSGYDAALQPIFQTSLMEQNNVNTLVDLADIGYFGVDEIVPNRNFLINDKGITYVFNKGEYSAYQLDAPVVFIPYQLIKSLLRENTPISTFNK